MTLKDLFKKFPVFFLTNLEKRGDFKLIKNLSIFIYPSIILIFIIYIVTFNSINNQKNENEKKFGEIFLILKNL